MNRTFFIGREAEFQELQTYYHSRESEFVVVYGRRRVGKTSLIKEFFEDTYDFKVTGLYKKSKQLQLKNFSLALEEYGACLKKYPSDWLEAFAELKKLLKGIQATGRKKVVFIDELPWLDTPKSDFLAAFESFWNGWGAQQNDLMLIVCGSATTWITEKLMENVGGLFNRAARSIYLHPFTLYETEKYFISRGIRWSRYDIIQTYMIFGGIPYYLKLIDASLPLSENIDRLVFRKKGPLWNEFSVLYETLFGRSEIYLKIIRALASKHSGLLREEISSLAKIPQNGDFSRALKNLSDCDFIRVYSSYGKKKKDFVYQLCDYYSLFYLRFIDGNHQMDEKYWSHTLDNPMKYIWAGYSFEQVCKDHLFLIKRRLGIDGVLTEISSWYGTDGTDHAQIDLIIARRDHVIHICEVKYCVDDFIIDKDYEKKLRSKLTVFRNATKTKSALQLVLLTTYGLKQNSHSGIVASQITMDDLFLSK